MDVILRNGECNHIKIHHYPDGQKNITLDMEYFNNVKESIIIHCNIRDFSELELLICIVRAFQKNDFHVKQIHFLYLFGMRSDRAFEIGMPNYFRDVLAPILNYLDVSQIRILAPHSQLGTNALISSDSYMRLPDLNGCIILGADASFDRTFNHYDSIPHFDKQRKDDRIEIYLQSEFYSKIEDAPDHLPIMIMDDLCDGGGTFIAIAEYLKLHFPERKRFLYIVHGLFTKGVEHVVAHYDKIITTNSYQDFKDEHIPKLEVIDVWSN